MFLAGLFIIFVCLFIVLCGLFICTNYSQTSSNTINDKKAGLVIFTRP